MDPHSRFSQIWTSLQRYRPLVGKLLHIKDVADLFTAPSSDLKLCIIRPWPIRCESSISLRCAMWMTYMIFLYHHGCLSFLGRQAPVSTVVCVLWCINLFSALGPRQIQAYWEDLVLGQFNPNIQGCSPKGMSSIPLWKVKPGKTNILPWGNSDRCSVLRLINKCLFSNTDAGKDSSCLHLRFSLSHQLVGWADSRLWLCRLCL